jgi:hypothetical protein
MATAFDPSKDIYWFEDVGSTMDKARELLKNEEYSSKKSFVVVANSQVLSILIWSYHPPNRPATHTIIINLTPCIFSSQLVAGLEGAAGCPPWGTCI